MVTLSKSNKNFYERIKTLADINTTNNVNESNNKINTLETYLRSDNGDAYGVIKENHNYYIKKSNKKGDLNESDFAYIGGIENSGKYKYNSLGEAQKQLNFVIKSINEAFSLGEVYNKLDENTTQSSSLNVKEDINSILRNRIQNGKKNLAESTERKFKEKFSKKEVNTNKIQLMNEDATKAIQKALGKINEEDLSTADSDQKDSDRIDNKNKVEKGQSNALNQDDIQKKADKNDATGKDKLEKEGGKNSISVNQSDEILTENEDLSTADSELNSNDSLVNHTGHKESSQAPINDENAKSEAEKRDAKSNVASVTPENTSGNEDIVSEGQVTGDPFKENKKSTKNISTADSDQKDSDRVDNKSKVEKADAEYNNHNQPEKGHKEQKGTELKPVPSKKDIVAETKDLSTADSELKPEDSVANDTNDPQKKHGKSEIVADSNLDSKKSLANDTISNLKNPVAEAKDLSTADSELKPDDSVANENDGNIEYNKGNLEKGTSFNANDNSIAEDSTDGSEELDAAIQAMDDLDIAVDSEESEEENIQTTDDNVEEPVDDVEANDQVDDDTPEEPVDVNNDQTDTNDSDDNETDSAKNISRMVGKIGYEAKAEDHTSDEVKAWINQITAAFEDELSNMPVEDRKAIADKILKIKPDEDSDETSSSGLDKEAENAIDDQIASLDDNDKEKQDESTEKCDECGTFENYMESRGYSKDDLTECSSMEMGNLVSGYANAYKKGMNDGDHEGIAIYITPEVSDELKGYGHSDFIEELDPFVKKIGEAGVKFGVHEPTITTEDDHSDAVSYAKKFEKEIEKTGKSLDDMTDDEKTQFFNRMDSVHKAKNENTDVDTVASDLAKKEGGDVMLKKALSALQNIPNPDQETKDLIKSYQKALGMSGDFQENKEPNISAVAEVLGAGVVKPESNITYENVNENKIRKYVRNKLEELSGKTKKSINENTKSEKMKTLDKLIENQWNLLNEK